VKHLAILILLLPLIFTGCAGLKPGADPIIVRAQQTERAAFETFDAFLRIERKNAARIRTAAPEVSKFAEWLRAPLPDGPRGIALVKSLGNVRRAYANAKTPDNRAKLAELPAEARAIVSNVVAQAELPEKEAQRARIAAEIAAKQAELNKLAP